MSRMIVVIPDSRDGAVPPWLVSDLKKINNDDPTFTELNLRYKYIGAGGAGAIRKALMKTRHVKTLKIGGVGPVAVTAIAEGVRDNTSLEEIQVELFTNGENTDDVPDILGQGIGKTTTLVKFRLFWSQIGIRGMASIAEGLCHNNTVVTLNLGYNNIGDAGMKLLSRALKHNSTVRGLYLQQNNIGREGGIALGEGIEENTGVECLSMDGNNLEKEGLAALRDALERKNVTLKWIYIDMNESYEKEWTQVGYWSALNRADRRYVRNVSVSLPWALWPRILAKVSPHPALLYGFLRDKPDLFKRHQDFEERNQYFEGGDNETTHTDSIV